MLLLLEGAVAAQPSSSLDYDDGRDPFAALKKQIRQALVQLKAEMLKRQPSHTMVLEAAVFLLQHNLLSVQRLGRTNVKQGRALLIWAAWLQHRKSLEWIAENKLDRCGLVPAPKALRQLELILVGGAGTGTRGGQHGRERQGARVKGG